MSNSLAIIIPAYKSDFLDDCISSIANQTNKDFRLYIGNDCSQYDIESVVDKYKDSLDIVYKKFQDNLGGISLIKQWERCIAMSNDEEWIWLFSDDDMMDVECVESFYNQKAENLDCNVFRFNLQVVNANGDIERTTTYPYKELPENFLLNRFALKYESAISNYIFDRKAYREFGFVEFPLGWCSDDASIVNVSNGKSIITIPEGKVQWRLSDSNISALGNVANQTQKVYSRLEFVKWLYTAREFPSLKLSRNKKIVFNWMNQSIKTESGGLPKKDRKKMQKKMAKIIGKSMAVHKLKRSAIMLKNRVGLLLKHN